MDGFTLSIKAKKHSLRDYEKDFDRVAKDEWRLAAGLKNYHTFELDDWIPDSYLDLSDDELMMR